MITEVSRKKKTLRLARVALICLLAALMIEFILANRERLFVYDSASYPETDPAPYCLDAQADGGYLLFTDGPLIYEDIPGGLFSVSFDIRYTDEAVHAVLPAATVNITTFDPRTTWQSDGFITVATEEIPVGENGDTRSVTVYTSTVRDTAGDLKITFTNLAGSVKVSNVRLNTPPAWTLSPLRVLLLFAVLFIPSALAVTGLLTLRYDPRDLRHRYAVRTAAVFTVILSILFAALFLLKNESIPYPLSGSVRSYQPYIQQFDAFMKGQLHLDVPVSEEMLGLENPYDYDSRADAAPLWDRAYYDGKYYSYFGIAPILLVYFPYHLITGALPADSFVMTVFLLISAVFIPLTVIKWADLHEDKTLPIPLLWLGAVTAFIGSMVLLVARGVTPFYYIATAAGSAFLSLFLFLLLKAAEAERLRDRCILYVLAGLAYTALLHSRLNIALLAAFIVLPYLWFRVLKRREPSPEAVSEAAADSDEMMPPAEGTATDGCKDSPVEEAKAKKPAGGGFKALLRRIPALLSPPKQLIPSLCCLGIPVILGLLAALALNKARFGSFLEFGTTYQLTVSDISYNKVSLGDLFPAIYHYFFQPLQSSTAFPFVSLQRLSMNDYGHYVYIDAGLGLFSLPLFGALALSPAICGIKERTRYEKVLAVALPLGLVTVALLNFSLGGVIFRYTADLTVLAAIGAVLIGFALFRALAGKDDGESTRGKTAGAVLAVFFLASIAVALLLTVSANGNLTKYSSNVFIAIKNFFSFR